MTYTVTKKKIAAGAFEAAGGRRVAFGGPGVTKLPLGPREPRDDNFVVVCPVPVGGSTRLRRGGLAPAG